MHILHARERLSLRDVHISSSRRIHQPEEQGLCLGFPVSLVSNPWATTHLTEHHMIMAGDEWQLLKWLLLLCYYSHAFLVDINLPFHQVQSPLANSEIRDRSRTTLTEPLRGPASRHSEQLCHHYLIVPSLFIIEKI